MRVPRRSSARRSAVAVALAIVLAALPSVALAATVAELTTLALQASGMTCTPAATSVTCHAPANRFHPDWTAFITPASGPEATLDTAVQTGQLPLDVNSRAFMTQMHQLACQGPKGAVGAFVNAVGDLTKSNSLGPVTIGGRTFTGKLSAPGTTVPSYVVSSVVLPPTPPPPTPTAAPTPKPTPKPTPTPLPSPTLAPSPSPSIAPSASPSPAPTLAPTPAATLANGAEATAGPQATEPTGIAGGGGSGPAPSLPTFSQSVLDLTAVNTEAEAVGWNLLLALLLLLIIGFAGELFNNTVENNYSEISGWFRKGPLGWLRRMGGKVGGEARTGLLAFLGLTALISCFVDPHFGLDGRSLGEFLGFLVGLIVVLASFKLPMMLAHRRKTGDLGRLRPLPWALVIAALFVLVSRLGNLQPGYLYGIVLGAIFVREVPAKEEGHETFYGSIWTLGAAALGWLGLTWVRSLGFDPNGFGVTLLSTAFAAVLVAGLEATAFGLMPLRFMPGHAVYRWNRLGWGLLFGLAVFAFIHLLISPCSRPRTYQASLPRAASSPRSAASPSPPGPTSDSSRSRSRCRLPRTAWRGRSVPRHRWNWRSERDADVHGRARHSRRHGRGRRGGPRGRPAGPGQVRRRLQALLGRRGEGEGLLPRRCARPRDGDPRAPRGARPRGPHPV